MKPYRHWILWAMPILFAGCAVRFGAGKAPEQMEAVMHAIVGGEVCRELPSWEDWTQKPGRVSIEPTDRTVTLHWKSAWLSINYANSDGPNLYFVRDEGGVELSSRQIRCFANGNLVVDHSSITRGDDKVRVGVYLSNNQLGHLGQIEVGHSPEWVFQVTGDTVNIRRINEGIESRMSCEVPVPVKNSIQRLLTLPATIREGQ